MEQMMFNVHLVAPIIRDRQRTLVMALKAHLIMAHRLVVPLDGDRLEVDPLVEDRLVVAPQVVAPLGETRMVVEDQVICLSRGETTLEGIIDPNSRMFRKLAMFTT